MNYLVFLILRLFVSITNIMSFRALYVFSDIIYFFLYKVFAYRKATVRKNFLKAFPDLDKSTLKKYCRSYYHFLCDLLLEGFKGMNMEPEEIMKRHKIINPELANQYFETGKSIIAVAGHYGNWEWGAFSGGIQLKSPMVAFYKPISNKYVERYMRKRRTQFRCELVSIYETFHTFAKYKDTPVLYIMVADQSPNKVEQSYWVNFLNTDTACLHGPEKYSRMYQIPVIYIDIQRVKRGFYEITLKRVVDNPSTIQEGGITAKFMQLLEQTIRTNPPYWLWSHRRWKHTR